MREGGFSYSTPTSNLTIELPRQLTSNSQIQLTSFITHNQNRQVLAMR